MRGRLLGLLLAAAAVSHALAGPIAVRPVVAAPPAQQAASQVKGGAICIKQGPITASEMRHAIQSGGLDARLREEMTKAGAALAPAGLAAAEVAGVARVSQVDVCLPNWGLNNVDTIGGRVEVAADWTLTDRASGTEIGRLSTRELLERKPGPGGLLGMVSDAFAANARALAISPAFQQAAARPVLSQPVVDQVVLRDPALRIVEPWRRTSLDAPLAIAIPQIIDSDIDAFDFAGHEFFAVQVQAGETLKLELLDTSAPLAMRIFGVRSVDQIKQAQPGTPIVASRTDAGTCVVEVWPKGFSASSATYRLKIDTDRRPYTKPQPKPPEPVAPSKAETPQAAPRATDAPSVRKFPPRPPFAPPVFVE